jgi:type II restriction enzyme
MGAIILDRTSKRNKWTLMKYIKDFDLMILYADAVRNGKADVSDKALKEILSGMELDDLYHPRFGKPSVHTIHFKICQVVYYMFAQKIKIKGNKVDKLIFSPLGNLLLDNKDDKRLVSRTFLTMLIGMPFKHPFNKMHKSFNIYPFRLIFKLLCDFRLEGKLYHDEVFYFVMFTKNTNDNHYENLINEIQKFRLLKPEKKYEIFTSNKTIEDVLANGLHEWNYTSGVLEQSGIINWHKSVDNYGVLIHGNGSGRRRYKSDYISLKPELGSFCQKLIDNYGFDEKPQELYQKLQLNSEYVTSLYNFYPIELLDELNIKDSEQESIISILGICEEINHYAKNKSHGDAYKFEDILTTGLNYFYDVVAEKHASAGTTDIECIFTNEEVDEKFDVEAKSTKKKLLQINAGRLRHHREIVNSKYTIVITPNFAPAVLEDIKKSKNVILRSSSFSNFLYQSISKNGREISYEPIHNIINNNLGVDITPHINQYVYENFGIESK